MSDEPGAQRRPTDPALPRCAGAIRRGVATFVDMLVFAGLSVLLAWPVSGAIDWRRALGGIDLLAAQVADPTWASHASSVAGLWIALWWCYFAVGWGLAGATPGKWLVGLRVIDHRGGVPIGITRGLLRLVAYTVSSATLGVGHALILFRRDRRALHDLLAGTRVVDRRSARRLPATTPDAPVPDGGPESEPDTDTDTDTDEMMPPQRQ